MDPITFNPAEWFAQMDGFNTNSLFSEGRNQPTTSGRDVFQESSDGSALAAPFHLMK
jgi:hypothetical protein